MRSRYYKVPGNAVGYPGVDMFFIDTSPLVHAYRVKVDAAIATNVTSQIPAAELA